jgi:hypothetical protein
VDSPEYREQKEAAEELQNKIKTGVNTKADKNTYESIETDIDAAFWQAVIAYQGYPFHTSSGLLFTYTIKKNRQGAYSGELIVSRKEESKTLTKSSVMLAFHTVLNEIAVVNEPGKAGETTTALVLPEYKGPKAIGQIFGISYVYSLLWKLGLISVPEKVEDKLKGRSFIRV